MKKIMNDPMNFVDESLEGIILAYPDQLRYANEEKRGIVRVKPVKNGKVAIATGGGSGHLPTFLGYVGEGLADGASVGNVFTSPSSDAMVNVAKDIHEGAGLLFLYGNYFGDKMNFDIAAEELEEEYEIAVKSVRISDDAASAPKERKNERRGVAGIFFAYKIAGACAEEMKPLTEVAEVAMKVNENVSTMGVALSSCIIPAAGKPTFSIKENEMEIGMGIHGEPGIERTELKTAQEICGKIIEYLEKDLDLKSGDEVAVLINGSGATPLEELYIVNKEVNNLLKLKNIKIIKTFVGEYATSLEMAGCSISLLKLDEELKHFINKPAKSPFFQY